MASDNVMFFVFLTVLVCTACRKRQVESPVKIWQLLPTMSHPAVGPKFDNVWLVFPFQNRILLAFLFCL